MVRVPPCCIGSGEPPVHDPVAPAIPPELPASPDPPDIPIGPLPPPTEPLPTEPG